MTYLEACKRAAELNANGVYRAGWDYRVSVQTNRAVLAVEPDFFVIRLPRRVDLDIYLAVDRSGKLTD